MSQKENLIEVHVDGGARGNPGPAAAGAVLGPPVDKHYSKYLGETTNNDAEYQSVVLALQKLKSLLGKKKAKETNVKVFMDSQLAVKQLSDEYKIENETIALLYVKIRNLRMEFSSVEFEHIRREKNKEADKLVNMELDKHTQSNSLFDS